MIEFLRRNTLIAALAVLCVVLAGIVVLEIVTTNPAAGRAPRGKPMAAEAKLLPPLAATAVDQVYPETVNRPLWIPTRRPAPPVAVAAASFVRGQFILQGVTIAGETRIALLKEKASGRIHRVEKGRDVNGIQVAEVEPERVTLAQGAEREVLELQVLRPVGAGQSPTAAAQSAAGPFAATGQSAPGATPVPNVPGAAAPAPQGFPAGQSNPTSQPNPTGQPSSMGPLAPNQPGPSVGQPANPSAAAVPQPATTAPMTPEELLARRRARRNQSP